MPPSANWAKLNPAYHHWLTNAHQIRHGGHKRPAWKAPKTQIWKTECTQITHHCYDELGKCIEYTSCANYGKQPTLPHRRNIFTVRPAWYVPGSRIANCTHTPLKQFGTQHQQQLEIPRLLHLRPTRLPLQSLSTTLQVHAPKVPFPRYFL